MLHGNLVVLNPKNLILFLDDDHNKFVRQKLLKINFGEMAESFILVRQKLLKNSAGYFTEIFFDGVTNKNRDQIYF